MLEKMRGALQMKMTATCGIKKFRLKGKNKTLVKLLGGGHQHRTTPAGQILGVATPATPAALTPMIETCFRVYVVSSFICCLVFRMLFHHRRYAQMHDAKACSSNGRCCSSIRPTVRLHVSDGFVTGIQSAFAAARTLKAGDERSHGANHADAATTGAQK